MKKILLTLLCTGLFSGLMAQKKEQKNINITTEVTDSDVKGKKKVKIVKNINGKTEVIEKLIDADSTEKTMVFIDENSKVETITEGKDGKKIIMKIDGRGDGEEVWEGHDSDDVHKEIRIYRNGKGERLGRNIGREFDFQFENLHERLNEMPYNIRNKGIYIFDDFNTRTIPNKGIKNLDVYTNQPESNVINVRFNAPEEGDVKILVIDLDGKVVSKSEEKAFKGAFMDQVRLPKDTKGTFFVIVSQGSDGVSRKVIVGETANKEVKK
jgi:hypothetical protein